MNTKIGAFLGLPLLALAFLMTGLVASAMANPRLTLTYAHCCPADHTYGIYAHQFADRVAENSGGEIKVEVLDGGVMGTEQTIAQKVQLGTVLGVLRALVALPLDRLLVLVVEEDELLIDLDARRLDSGVHDLDRSVLGEVDLDEVVVALDGDENGMGHWTWLLIRRRTSRPHKPKRSDSPKNGKKSSVRV